MKVSEAMTAQVVTATPSTTIAQVARTMAEIESGAVPVVDDGKVVGLITDRDIVLQGVAKGGALTTPASDVMSGDVQTCKEDDNLADAAARARDCPGARTPHGPCPGARLAAGTAGDLLANARAAADIVHLRCPGAGRLGPDDPGLRCHGRGAAAPACSAARQDCAVVRGRQKPRAIESPAAS